MHLRNDHIDLTGQQFGDLKVLGIDEEATDNSKKTYAARQIFWKCECQRCGDILSRTRTGLKKIIERNSSGCSRCHGKWLVGQKFGRLTILEDLGYQTINNRRSRYLKCLCDCGKELIVAQADILSKHVQSCGCLRIETTIMRDKERAIRGGDSVDPENIRLYGIWCGMKDRCYRKEHNRYYRYGARGIKVCDEWMDYLKFKEWALSNGYTKELSIDRIDTDGDYKPSNCKWSTREEQMNNTSRNINIEYKGRIQTLTQWCRELGLNYGRVKARIYSGFTPEQAFETPLRGLIRSHRNICKIPGCNRFVKGEGYCQKHYQRFKKYGDPFIVQRNNGKLVRVDT